MPPRKKSIELDSNSSEEEGNNINDVVIDQGNKIQENDEDEEEDEEEVRDIPIKQFMRPTRNFPIKRIMKLKKSKQDKIKEAEEQEKLRLAKGEVNDDQELAIHKRNHFYQLVATFFEVVKVQYLKNLMDITLEQSFIDWIKKKDRKYVIQYTQKRKIMTIYQLILGEIEKSDERKKKEAR